ncbi:MAG TPA: VWA domain-containing protein [Terriglobales bacterium]|nr:VWA domain-containing protein [Terriglobales bacterium]
MRLSGLPVILVAIALRAGIPLLQGQQSIPPRDPSAPQLPQSAPSVPTFGAVARAVVLDIAVVDAEGRPVKGLMEGDFTLLEDGARQTLKSFEEHNSATLSNADHPPKLPTNTFTNDVASPNRSASTIILLDALDTSIQAQMYAYEQVSRYMKHVPPGTSMAIFDLDYGMHLVQDFSSDPQVLLDAIKSKRSSPRLGFCESGRPDCQRRRHDLLVEGMRELGSYLSGIPGRKNLVWFVGVVPHEIYGTGIGNPFRDRFDFVDDLSQTNDLLTLNRVAVYPVDVRGLIAPSGGGETHIGLRVGYQDDSLEQVAEATGGKAFYNTNGLDGAIAEVVDTGSNYYTVSYTPTNNNWNGEFRHIKVELDKRGYSLEYRHGYRARNREAQEERHLASVEKKKSSGRFVPASSTEPVNRPDTAPQGNLQDAMSFGAIPSTELIFTASLTPAAAVQKIRKKDTLPPDNYLGREFESKPFREYTILYATDIRGIDLKQTADGVRHGQVDFVAVLYDDRGEVVNSLISSASLDLSAPTYRRLAQSGFSVSQPLAIPVKGNFFLRLGVRDAVGDRVGAMEIAVDQIKLGVAGAGQTLAP